MKRLVAAFGLALATVVAGSLAAAPAALAHERAIAELVTPAEGQVVDTGTVEVLVTASGAGAPAEFSLFLDDQPVDGTGRIGGVFASLRVNSGEELRIQVPLSGPGSHVLRLVPAAHEQPDPEIVRTFTSTAAATSSASVPASASASAAPAAPAASPDNDVDRGTVLIVLLGCGLLGAGIGAVIVSRSTS